MSEVTIDHLKQLLVENCMIKVDPADISEDTPLFGPEGLALDSLDALQIVIAVEKHYGIIIGDPATAKDALQSLAILRDWIIKRLVVRSTVVP